MFWSLTALLGIPLLPMIYRGAACQFVCLAGLSRIIIISGRLFLSVQGRQSSDVVMLITFYFLCLLLHICLFASLFYFGGRFAGMGSNFTYLASKTRRSGNLRGGQRTVPEFETQTIEMRRLPGLQKIDSSNQRHLFIGIEALS